MVSRLFPSPWGQGGAHIPTRNPRSQHSWATTAARMHFQFTHTKYFLLSLKLWSYIYHWQHTPPSCPSSPTLPPFHQGSILLLFIYRANFMIRRMWSLLTLISLPTEIYMTLKAEVCGIILPLLPIFLPMSVQSEQSFITSWFTVFATGGTF